MTRLEKSTPRLPRWHDAAAVAVYLLLAAMVTWPLLPQIHRETVGIANGDVWDHLWTMNHARRAVVEPGVELLRHPDAYYPEGLVLFPLNVLNELLSVPLQMAFGLAASYNLMILLQLVFAGWAGYRLVLYLVESPVAAWSAGALFACSPSTLSAFVNGVPEAANSGWIPLYIWLLMKHTRSTAPIRTAIPTAIVLFLSAVSSWYIGAFNLIFTALYSAYQLAFGGRQRRKAILRRVPGATLVGCSMIVPVAVLFRGTLEHADASHFRDATHFIGRTLQDPTYSARPLSFLLPGKGWSTAGFAHSSFIGFTVLVLATLGFALSRKERRACGFWATSAVAFGLLALGPVLWSGKTPGLRLPYYYFMKYVPLFHGIEFPYRFTIMATLSLCILAAFGIRWVNTRVTSGTGVAVGGLVVLLGLIEYAADIPFPLPRAALSQPVHLAALHKEQPTGAVIEFPLGFEFKGQHFYHQIAHGHPVVVGINSLCPRQVLDALGIGESIPLRIELSELSGDHLAALRERGIRYLAWNRRQSHHPHEVKEFKRRHGFRVIRESREGTVFDLATTDQR